MEVYKEKVWDSFFNALASHPMREEFTSRHVVDLAVRSGVLQQGAKSPTRTLTNRLMKLIGENHWGTLTYEQKRVLQSDFHGTYFCFSYTPATEVPTVEKSELKAVNDISLALEGISPPPSGVNPFDHIRKTRPDGSEFWSARDLIPLLGYDRWERVPEVIERARTSARVQGLGVEEHFRASSKTLPQTNQHGVFERTVSDYHLSRFACYLVAMNGDPRKPEVAAAQGYFAVQTRKAEVMEQQVEQGAVGMMQLERLAGLTVRAIENKAQELRVEVQHELQQAKAEFNQRLDERVGALQATSEQQREVKSLVGAVVHKRSELGVSGAVFGSVYFETWRACNVGSLGVMTRTQFPKVKAYLTAELARLSSMDKSGLFDTFPQA